MCSVQRDEMDATEEEAESALKDHNGDLVAALRAITV
jgi:NACalpha-BTF3-like transcription factor